MARIPAVIRAVDEAGMQTLALVENLQREDLNAIEKAKAIKAMAMSQSLTHEQVADRLGKDRATVTNFVRLLELPDEVKALVEEGRLSASQARAVLQVQGDANRARVARLAVERDLSVRDLERMSRLTAGAATKAKRKAGAGPFVADLEERLRRALSARVHVVPRGKGGTISVEYADAAQLDALLETFGAA